MIRGISSKLPKANSDLPTLVGRNFAYISDWAEQNESEFESVMDKLADQAPDKWANVYVKVLQILSVQSKLPNKIQVKHTLDEDISRLRNLSSQQEATKFADYEEVQAK